MGSSDIEQRIQQLEQEFAQFSSWEDKYRHIISKGKKLAPFPDDLRKDELKVKGCQSQVWLYADFDDDSKRLLFQADSDASIVKGIIAILLDVYHQATPQEVLTIGTSFLDSIGLRQHLSMSRANGLNSMVKQIQIYAMAFQVKMTN